MNLIAKTFQGLEQILAEELTALGANEIQISNRAVSFEGDKELLYRANFSLRTALRVLMPISTFKAKDPDDVYNNVKQIDWSKYMDTKSTFLVDAVVFSEEFRHSKFVAYRVKDAIADYFREKTDDRPNVSISDPDIRVNVHISQNIVTISLDSSGESLHKRGYKTANVEAPINEVLAAGIILMTGWKGECDLIDPFCGSGTFLIEAALIAKNIAPGIYRKQYGFEHWKDFDKDLFERIYEDDSNERAFSHKIYGFDLMRKAVSVATNNVNNASLNDCIEVKQRDINDFEHEGKALMITNPPYGQRLTPPNILQIYQTIGTRLKQHFVDNDAWIICSSYDCFDQIGFRASTKIALLNGELPCELRKYQVFNGKLKERREQGMRLKTDKELEANKHFKRKKMSDDKEEREKHYFKSLPNTKGEFFDRRSFKWSDRKRKHEE